MFFVFVADWWAFVLWGGGWVLVWVMEGEGGGGGGGGGGTERGMEGKETLTAILIRLAMKMMAVLCLFSSGVNVLERKQLLVMGSLSLKCSRFYGWISRTSHAVPCLRKYISRSFLQS